MEGINPIAFYLISIFTVLCAVIVTRKKNLFHAGIMLVFCFTGIAAVLILLGAFFLAAVHVLLYVGAISVFILFAIMMTPGVTSPKKPVGNKLQLLALAVSVVLLMLMETLTSNSNIDTDMSPDKYLNIAVLGKELLTTYVFPFEVVSIVLFIAVLGAIILMKRERENKK